MYGAARLTPPYQHWFKDIGCSSKVESARINIIDFAAAVLKAVEKAIPWPFRSMQEWITNINNNAYIGCRATFISKHPQFRNKGPLHDYEAFLAVVQH